MEKSLKSHTIFIKNALEANGDGFDWRALSEFNLMQIGFFQHERIVHLLVTLFFGLILIAFFISGIILANLWFLVLGAVALIMTGFYIRHYFILENGVQELYFLERDILKRFEQSVSDQSSDFSVIDES
jgi:hypothetical protein